MNDARFELRLASSQRQSLAALASAVGLSSADLARLAIRELLRNPNIALADGSAAEAHPAQLMLQPPAAGR